MSSPKKKKSIIGITGGIGSGKSLVSSLFSSLGIPIYNSDIEAKNLYKTPEVRGLVIKKFGNNVYKGKELDKKLLAQIVFSDKNKLEELNSMIHPLVGLHFQKWISECSSKILIKEAAILIESKAYLSCDKIIHVSCPDSIKIKRVMARDQSSEKEILQRINNQLSDSEREKYADWIITNDGKTSVLKQVYDLYENDLYLLAMK